MNGKVYQIVCLTTGEKYIGSTTQSLGKRLSGHKSDYKRWKNGVDHFVSSFTILERDNYQIELLEECPNYKERERFYIENTVCVNLLVVGRTNKEWREENKETILEKHKEHYKDNKTKILEKHKEWRKKNKEYQKEYMRQYRLKKKEENKR
jgi:predicted nucleic-acid-binding protein